MRPSNPGFLAAALAALLTPWPAFASPLGGEASVGEAPFHPFWTGDLSLGYSAEDGGQQGGGVSLTGRESLSAQGSFFEAGLTGRSLQVEGTQAGAFGFSMGGGVGLGDLTPSLLVDLESGDSHLNTIRVRVGAEKSLAADLLLDLSLDGEVTSHQGPLGALVGLPAGSPSEIDDLNALVGAAVQWSALPALDLSGALRAESDETVKVQDPTHTLFNEVDSTEWTYTLSLGARLALGGPLALTGRATGGLDAEPAGTFYSKREARTLTLASAQKVFFGAAALGLDCRF